MKRHVIAGAWLLKNCPGYEAMRTGIHLGIAKVTDLQPGRWPAIKQCVFQLEISMTNALQNSKKNVPAATCFAAVNLRLNM